jgi:hypothetical protein
MLQLYPPYKNLVPRFLGKREERKETKDRVTPIFNDLLDLRCSLLEEIGPLHRHQRSASYPSFEICCPSALKKRGNNSRGLIFTKIEYFMANSWMECSETSLEMTT